DRLPHGADLLVRPAGGAQLPVHLDALDRRLERAQRERRTARARADDVAAQEIDHLLVGEALDLGERRLLTVHALGDDRGRGLADGEADTFEPDGLDPICVGSRPHVHRDDIAAAGIAAGHALVRILHWLLVAGPL